MMLHFERRLDAAANSGMELDTSPSLLAVGGVLLLELVQDGERLVDLAVQGLLVLEEMEKLSVVHLEQHTSDLASELRFSTAKR